jgi:serine/threonine protein kinase
VSLGDFNVVHPIGKGGSANVFLVTRKERARTSRQPYRLALKAVPKHQAFDTDTTLQHVLDERLALQLVSDHPFVITLRHAFQTTQALYLVTDFCQRGDMLSGLLSQRPGSRISEEEARPLFAQIALALEHLHAHSIVHRDLKAENILLADDGSIRLADFGLSKVLTTGRFGRTKSFCGTATAMSPQIISSRSTYGIATDLWSLGVLLYRVLVGRSPFDLPKGRARSAFSRAADDREIFSRIQNDEPVFPSYVSPEARELIRGLLRKEEPARFNMSDLQESAFFESVDWDETLERGRDASAAIDSVSAVSASAAAESSCTSMATSLSTDSGDTTANFNMTRLADVKLVDKSVVAIEAAAAGATSVKPSIIKRVVSSAALSSRNKRPSSTSIIGYAYSPMEDNELILNSRSNSQASLDHA